MIITSKVKMDLMQQPWTAAIDAVQNDRYARNLEITLFSGGTAWPVPEGVSVLIRYKKYDGKGGAYDSLPDGTAAWTAAGNVLTVALAPQVLTAAGSAKLSVTLVQGEKQLSTFEILIHVHPAVGADLAQSEDYFYVTGFLPAPSAAKTGQYVRITSTDENGKVTGVEAVDLSDISGGETNPAEIQKIVDEYLEENPPAGKIPVKGVDYYTEADKTEMVSAVLAALPAAEGVAY